MRSQALLVALILACRPDVAESPTTAAPTPTTAPAPPPAPAPAGPETPATPAPPADRIDADLRLILGGNFSPDHLGPDEHAAVLARARRHAADYAQRILRLHGDRARTAPAVLDLHLAAALTQLYPHAPDRVAHVADALHGNLSMQQHGPPLDDRQKIRLRDQLAVLRVLAGGIDRPLPATPDLKTPDRVCTSATPDGHGLTPEVTCACGDVLACAVTRRGDALELTLHRVPAPQICDDCYPSWTTCTVPRLNPGEQLRLVHAARDLGRLTADPGGWLPAGTCLPSHAAP